MTSTTVIIEHRPRVDIHECLVCTARWGVPTGSDEEAVNNRSYMLGVMAKHICDPFVSVDDVARVRERAADLAIELGASPSPLDEPMPTDPDTRQLVFDWLERARRVAESLTIEFDADAAVLGVARTIGSAGNSPADSILSSARTFAEKARESDRDRAFDLATNAVFRSGFSDQLSKDAWRPDHARLALTLIDEARRTRRDLLDTGLVIEMSDQDAVAWLEDFERKAVGIL